MTLRQIESFLALARDGSFTRAARRLHLSQPTLSEHVQELERELGKPLFARRYRQVVLTEAGRTLEPYANRVMATLESASQAVAELDGLQHGSLVVGASTTRASTSCPASSAAFAPPIQASRCRCRSPTH